MDRAALRSVRHEAPTSRTRCRAEAYVRVRRAVDDVGREGRGTAGDLHDHHRGAERSRRTDPQPDAGHPGAGRLRSWLDTAVPDAGELLRPYPADAMTAYPVSTRGNVLMNDDATLIEPLATTDSQPGT